MIIFGTGVGAFTTPQIDGTITTAISTPVLPITAQIDNQPATVTYAGSAPGLVAGVLQVNLQVPAQLPAGEHTVVISAGEWNNYFQYSPPYTH